MAQTPLTRARSARPGTLPKGGGLVVGSVLLLVSMAGSLTLGAADIPIDSVVAAMTAFDGSFDHLVVRTVRLPRVLAGVVVGAALAVAGAIMQGLTRNPLASPGILGVNAGASFAVVLAVLALGSPPLTTYALFAFVGAAVAAVFVYTLGSVGRGGATPLKLTLAGAVFAAFMASFTSAVLILDRETLDQVRFWTAGSLAGRDMSLVAATAPWMLGGMAAALLLGRQITTLSLGDDIATGLGQSTLRIKLAAALVVVVLAGGAVALAGPIGFVGLVAPHVARFLAGVDYRWVLPYAAVLGGLLVTVADIAARVALRPQEVPVGVMMALVGAPFFIYLARTKVRR
jgi:iron complex transport system permease protein